MNEVYLDNPICNQTPLMLQDIVCINLEAMDLKDLGNPEFAKKLDEFQKAIAEGRKQLHIYILQKPEHKLRSIRQHNATVLDIRQEIIDKEMLQECRVCVNCTRVFSAESYRQHTCRSCWDAE